MGFSFGDLGQLGIDYKYSAGAEGRFPCQRHSNAFCFGTSVHKTNFLGMLDLFMYIVEYDVDNNSSIQVTHLT
ncbi:hypothetical protein CH252_13025 [Rhodococcus sp. 06-1477-1B]|nr:hypothetical protein CH266_16255 [Rhodococcus sp. 06-1474-1B]OZD52783.1 hypothetical protein CH252_13025 [Rhodococcus sp. 06-1477-1B]